MASWTNIYANGSNTATNPTGGTLDVGAIISPPAQSDALNPFFDSLKPNGSSIAEQSDVKWYELSDKTDTQYDKYYTDLYTGFKDYWGNLGYNGPVNSVVTGNLGASGDGQGTGTGSEKPVDSSFKDFINQNGYGEIGGKNTEGFNLRQLTQNGKIIPNASISFSDPDPVAFSLVKGVVDLGLAFDGSSIGAGVSEGAGQAATNAALIDSAAGTAGYGVSSASNGFLYGAGISAVKGAAIGAEPVAMNGTPADIFKAALLGGAGGALSYGVSSINPGSYLTDSVAGQNVINKGISSGIQSGVKGEDPFKGALIGAGNNAFDSLVAPVTSNATGSGFFDKALTGASKVAFNSLLSGVSKDNLVTNVLYSILQNSAAAGAGLISNYFKGANPAVKG